MGNSFTHKVLACLLTNAGWPVKDGQLIATWRPQACCRIGVESKTFYWFK